MRPFVYETASTPADALRAAMGGQSSSDLGASSLQSPIQFLAGGTTLIDLMKLDVMRPEKVVDINALEAIDLGHIAMSAAGLRLGALVRMAEAAEHPLINRGFPVVAQSLKLAASQQLRNMASLGGNVLQRTRCTYFRDTSYRECNKRNPGSGCAALEGFNRSHAVLGVSSSRIATYAGDFAQALIALDASVEIAGPRGVRDIPFAALHRPPGDAPDVETTLRPGEMIVSFFVPSGPWTRRSVYLKVRDRQSYEFALASAAVALDAAEDGTIRNARIALGGVATVPWRASKAEAALKGRPITDEARMAAAEAAFAGARTRPHNAFKVALGKRTLMQAVAQAAAMEI